MDENVQNDRPEEPVGSNPEGGKSKAVQYYTAPLPAKSDLKRQIQVKPSLNDLVEPIFLALYDDAEFNPYIVAGFDEEAVEGKTMIDDVIAAQKIKQHAVEHGPEEVATKNLGAIIRSLRVVAKRWGVGRKQRRRMVGGEDVGDNDDD